jgi:predicted glycoside hydrolase/deacetylase ChbG (UPF0249 family)
MTPGRNTIRRRHIVVNADDFGMSPAINRGIIEAFGRSLVSSATVMANMPAFEEACALACRNNLSGKVGLHLNFTSGRPLSTDIAHYPRFCDAKGCWRPQRKVFALNKAEQLALEAEILAQTLACERHGITPTHWDSHHHMHTEPGIAPVVIRVAHRLGVKAIRPGLNCGPGRDGTSATHRFLAQTYRDLFNVRLRFHGLARAEYFGDARDAGHLIRTTTANVELMVHPMANSRGELVDSDGQSLEARIDSLGIPASEMSSYQSLLL